MHATRRLMCEERASNTASCAHQFIGGSAASLPRESASPSQAMGKLSSRANSWLARGRERHSGFAQEFDALMSTMRIASMRGRGGSVFDEVGNFTRLDFFGRHQHGEVEPTLLK
jgi:hypothetical protein